MNKVTVIILILFVFTCFGLAQDKEEPNTVLIVTNAADFKEGASVTERDSIWSLWEENVVKKNKYIKMEMWLRHFYGSNSEDLIQIREFNGSGLDIILKAAEENTRLYREWMPNKEDRQALNKLYGKYFKPGHSDEIYTLSSKVINKSK